MCKYIFHVINIIRIYLEISGNEVKFLHSQNIALIFLKLSIFQLEISDNEIKLVHLLNKYLVLFILLVFQLEN